MAELALLDGRVGWRAPRVLAFGTDVGPGPFVADPASSTCTKTGASLTGSAFVVRANATVARSESLRRALA